MIKTQSWLMNKMSTSFPCSFFFIEFTNTDEVLICLFLFNDWHPHVCLRNRYCPIVSKLFTLGMLSLHMITALLKQPFESQAGVLDAHTKHQPTFQL